jgi:ketosteroid isomerase-like protein
MAQEKLEFVRSIYADWERGDFASAEWAHPDIEFAVGDSFEAGGVTGLVRMAEAWHDWLSAWEQYRVEVDEYRKLDDERILVLMLHCGRGKTSGLDVGQTKRAGANVLHVRDGKVTKLVLYWDRERALADLGLSEEPMSQKNVEVLREAMEAFNRRDREAWLALNDPEVEFRADPEWPESGTVDGREAVWDFIVGLTDAWERDAFEMVEVIEAGGDKLVVRYRRPVRGKASGIADVLDYWCVNTVRRGKVLRHEWFSSHAKALEAVGLSE